MAQSIASEHLRILQAVGIITGEIERSRVCYALNTMALEPLRRFLNELADAAAAGNEPEQSPS